MTPQACEISVGKARYAKGMMIVRVLKNEHAGFKNRADRLCCYLGRWTHREKGYIMSPLKVERLKGYLADGIDASIMADELRDRERNVIEVKRSRKMTAIQRKADRSYPCPAESENK